MLNRDEELREFRAHKTQSIARNKTMYTARQAFENIYTWPRTFPVYKEKVVQPMVRKAVLTHANFLMGRGFTTNVEPLGPNPPQRAAAQRAEKALFKIVDGCNGWRSLWRGAQIGSITGTSIFKAWYDDEAGKATFSACQPEFSFPVPRGDDYNDVVKFYYAYSIDRYEAARRYGGSPESYKSEREVSALERGEPIDWRNPGYGANEPTLQQRRVPVLEVWTADDYLLLVGGKVVHQGDNPYGFIPFVVIPNIDSGKDLWGLSDVDALIPLNNQLNVLLSEHYYMCWRYANPIIVWQNPPANYASHLQDALGGPAVLPVRFNGLGGGQPIYQLQLGQPPELTGLIDRMRSNGIEVSGLNELAWSGTGGGSINTGPSLEINFSNVISTLSAKQKNWEVGLRHLFYMLMRLGSQMGDMGVADNPAAKASNQRGMRVSGKDIGDHASVKITWPGLMPKDDMSAANFELSKMQAGVQSKSTTLAHLGFDFPDDELSLIRSEMADAGLNPKENANLMRAEATQTSANAKADAMAGGMGAPPEDPQLQDDDQEEFHSTGGELPPDLHDLSDTPPGIGTMPDGRGMDDYGQELDPMAQNLARFRAEQLRNRPGLDFGPAPEDDTGPDEAGY